VIDGHAHACGELLTPEGILGSLDANGVDKVVLVPGEHQSAKTYRLPNLARHFPASQVGSVTNAMTKVVVRASGAIKHVDEGNEFVFRLTQSCPGRVLQFLWVILGKGFDVSAVDARYRAWRFKGLKVHQCWDRFDVTDTAFGELADYAGARNLPVFVHPDGAAQARALAEVAAARCETTFIVGHLCGLEQFMQRADAIPNVYLDFSCPDIVSDLRLALALERFGAARLLLGSDSPYGRDNLARGIARVRALDITDGDKELMLGGNLVRLLRLESDEVLSDCGDC